MSLLAQVQYDRLRAAILSGEFAPGEFLLETAVASRYGVSRTPVREAMVRLAQEGLLDRAPRGFHVRRRSAQELIDVYDTRIALESAAARLAAERATADQVSHLAYLVESHAAETSSTAQDQLNALFHVTVVEASRNRTMIDMVDHARILLAMYRPTYAERRSAEDALRERAAHEGILAAVRDRDASAAHDLMEQHLTHGRDVRLRMFLEEQTEGQTTR